MALGCLQLPNKCSSQICVLQMGLAAKILARTWLQSCAGCTQLSGEPE